MAHSDSVSFTKDARKIPLQVGVGDLPDRVVFQTFLVNPHYLFELTRSAWRDGLPHRLIHRTGDQVRIIDFWPEALTNL